MLHGSHIEIDSVTKGKNIINVKVIEHLINFTTYIHIIKTHTEKDYNALMYQIL